MLDGWRRAGEEAGYWANYFHRDVLKKGGLATAKQLLVPKKNSKIDKGFQALIDAGLPHISVECIVLQPQFRTLFTDDELRVAQARMDAIPDCANQKRVPADEIRIDELSDDAIFHEGAPIRVLVNSYERNREARNDCLAKHGFRCAVCEMRFDEVYGDIGKDFIHVHHNKPLASRRADYRLDPHKDLVPVCPNCHAMLHSHNPPLTVQELRRQLRKPVGLTKKRRTPS